MRTFTSSTTIRLHEYLLKGLPLVNESYKRVISAHPFVTEAQIFSSNAAILASASVFP